MTYCEGCGAAATGDVDWCSFCLRRYKPLPRLKPRWWEATPTRHGIAGRAVWWALCLAVLSFPLATIDSIGTSPGRKLVAAAVVFVPVVAGAVVLRLNR